MFYLMLYFSYMNKDLLLEKRIAVEQKFNDTNAELVRLQGEYRALTALIEETEEPKVSDVPNEKELETV